MSDETTEKLFPPPETQRAPDPIPLSPSLRWLWGEYQRNIEDRFARFERLLNARLPAPPTHDDTSPKSAALKVLRGAGKGGRALLYLSGALGLASLVARALGRDDVATPIEQIQQFFNP